MSGEIPLQRVKLPSGKVHVSRGRRLIQLRQLTPQLGSVHRLDARLAARGEERLKAFVYEALNHDSDRIA